MKEEVRKILNDGAITNVNGSYKNEVKLYSYNNKKYYVKELSANEYTFKVLLSFKLLKLMNINIPNIKFLVDNNDLYLTSQECGTEKVAGIGELPQDPLLQQELAKIIYVADFLGLGDVANDNIIQNGNELFLIDFEPMGTSKAFSLLNVFGKNGGEDYSIGRSFDLHSTKGIIQKMWELEDKPITQLFLNEDTKNQIQEQFFSLTEKDLMNCCQEIINNGFTQEIDISSILKEYKNRFIELQKHKNSAQNQDIEEFNELLSNEPQSNLSFSQTYEESPENEENAQELLENNMLNNQIEDHNQGYFVNSVVERSKSSSSIGGIENSSYTLSDSF